MPHYKVLLAAKGTKEVIRFDHIMVERPDMIGKYIGNDLYDIVDVIDIDGGKSVLTKGKDKKFKKDEVAKQEKTEKDNDDTQPTKKIKKRSKGK